MASRLPHASRLSIIPSMLPSIKAACFLVGRPINATMYCIFIIFASLHSMSQTMGQRFPTRSTPCAPLGWLLCRPFKFGPLKAKATPIALLFDGVCVSVPNEGTNRGTTKTAGASLAWTHSKMLRRSWGRGGGCHGDRGQSCWGVGQRWIILVGCCVICGAV